MRRRDFIKAAVAAPVVMTTGIFTPKIACANTSDFWLRDRDLWVQRKDTREEFRVVFWSDGLVDVDNYVRLCYLLRDVEEKQTVMMDVNLFNLMYGLQRWNYLLTGKLEPFVATSGQRMPEHNRRVENAAWDSLHQYGKATDGGIRGVPHKTLAQQSVYFQMGGVGTYETHTHIDTGRVRTWDGSKFRRAPSQQNKTPKI